MAETRGFEPLVTLRPHSLSKRTRSTTPARLLLLVLSFSKRKYDKENTKTFHYIKSSCIPKLNKLWALSNIFFSPE